MVNPKLRFKRPDGTAYPDWEEKPLGSMTEIVARKAPKGSDAPIMMVSQGNGFIYQADKYSRENAGQSLKNYTLLYRGEFAYNHGASKAKPYGVAYELTEEDEARVPYVYHTFRFTEGVNRFWHNSLNTSQMDRKLKRLVSSGVRMDGLLNINYETYMGVPVAVPDETEQKAIADFFASVDEKIEAQEQYVAALEMQKKELLRQVFAREIRFKDENGQDYPQWEEHPLSDYLSFQNGVNADREAYGKGVKLISVRDILSGRPILYDMISGAVQIDDATLSRYSVAYGDVLFQRSSENYEDAGTANVYLDDKIATFSGFVIRGKKIAEYNPVFMYCALNDRSVRKQITRKAQGAQHVNVGQDTLASVIISVPSLPEQQRIADFFTALDAQIENERALLEDWRQLKKGLLQQMFV